MEGLLLPSLSGNGANFLLVLLGKCPTKGWAGQDRACCKGVAPMSEESRLLESHPQARNNLIKCLLG